jgi:hypothetical protein
MAIEYGSSPEFKDRQPAGYTLTEEQYAELNEQQARLLPDLNVGTMSGELRTRERISGETGVFYRLSGAVTSKSRISGRVKVRKL